MNQTLSGEVMATSAKVIIKWCFLKGIIPEMILNSGLGIIVICPDEPNPPNQPYQTLWHRRPQVCLQFFQGLPFFRDHKINQLEMGILLDLMFSIACII